MLTAVQLAAVVAATHYQQVLVLQRHNHPLILLSRIARIATVMRENMLNQELARLQ